MDPVVLLLLQLLAKYGPEVFLEAKSLLSKQTVTIADFAALDGLLAKRAEEYFK